MKYTIKLMLVTSCVVLVSTFLFANDPAKEFSIAKNPNGVWSYGFTPTLGASFSLADAKWTNFEYQQGYDFWHSTSQASCSSGIGGTIGRNEAPQEGSERFPQDTLHQHPGCHGELSVLRWIVPLSGTYQLRGSFWGDQTACGGTTTDVHIRWNSENPLLDADIYGFIDHREALFDLQQLVTAGDTIDFAVGFGSDGNWYCDGTALQLTIDLLPAINIKPGDPDNKIHIATPGMVAVAILSDASFDAPAMVVRSSLTFGRIGDQQSLVYKPDRFDTRLQVPVCSTSDVNGDGLKDLVCQFDKQLAGFQLTDTYGVLRGKTTTGITIKGTDAVQVLK